MTQRVGAREATLQEAADDAAGAVIRRAQAGHGAVVGNAEIGAGPVGAGQQHRLTGEREGTVPAQSAPRQRAGSVVPMDDARLAGYLLLVDRVVGRIEDEAKRCSEMAGGQSVKRREVTRRYAKP